MELYAREHGRTGSIEFVPPLGAWMVKLSLRPNDPRMQLYQQGLAAEPPTETVLLIEPNPEYPARSRFPNRPMDIYQMGAAGVRAHLEKGNTWGGRGEYASLTDQTRRVREANATAREKARTDARENATYRARHDRRHYEKVPTIPVGVDLNQKNG